MILGNCAIYSVTSRLDKLAVLAAGKTLYYAYGRVIMASTCFLGVRPAVELGRLRAARDVLVVALPVHDDSSSEESEEDEEGDY